jgi:hypothetical protein
MAQINIDSGVNVSMTINRGPLNGGTPQGNANTLQYNKSGVFGGVASVTSDGTKLIVNNVANLSVSGGTVGQVLSTDGAGGLSFIDMTGGGGTPAGGDFEIQFANAGNFSADANFLFIPASQTMLVPNISAIELTVSDTIATDSLIVQSSAQLGNLANITIEGGTVGQVVSTDGIGNLSFITLPTVADTPPAGSNTQVQFNDDGAFGADPEFYYNKSSNTLTVTNFTATNLYGNGMGLTDITGANVSGNVRLANFAFWSGNADVAANANLANFANFAGNITIAAQPNITSVGQLIGLQVLGTSDLGDASEVKISGGIANSALITDGNGNLTWLKVPGLGTVRQVGGDGSGLGLQLSGLVTDTGNLSLVVPNAATFRTNLDLGDVALLDLNYNANTLLNGRGEWVDTIIPPGGDSKDIQYNDSGVMNGSDTFTFDKLTEVVSVKNITVTDTFLANTANAQFGDIDSVSISGGSDGDLLSTDGNGVLSWSSAGNTKSFINTSQQSLTALSDAVIPLASLVKDALVESVSVYIDTVYDGTPTISVGVTGATDKYFTNNDVDMAVVDRWDVAYSGLNVPVGGETVNIYYNNGGQATTGTLRVIIRYSIPV